MMAIVDGTVTTQYTHILLIPPHPPSANEKKVVLKNALAFISGSRLIWARNAYRDKSSGQEYHR
jgi:hypothetical protein